MPIEIKNITFRNFMSYGDYDTFLPISDVGTALVTGEISDDPNKSNGAGKSTIIEAIVWCLFGRLTHKDRIGDNVMNWFTDSPCRVSLETKDGHKITRIREKGQSNIIFEKDGEDISLSTPTNTQEEILKRFQLDFSTFSASILFGQHSQSFLSLSDMKKRQAIEKVMHLVGLDIYASVAKRKLEVALKDQAAKNSKREALEAEITRKKEQLDRTLERSKEYENERKKKLIEIDKKILQVEESYKKERTNLERDLKREHENLKKIDQKEIAKARTIWNQIDKIKDAITAKQNDIARLEGRLEQAEDNTKRKENEASEWKTKKGTRCFSCKQIIDPEHADKQLQDIQNQINNMKISEKSIRDKISSIHKVIQMAKKKAKEKEPSMTLTRCDESEHEIKSLKSTCKRLAEDIRDSENNKTKQVEIYKQQSLEIKAEKNPHGDAAKESENEIDRIKKELEESADDCAHLDILIKHLTYIDKSYRSKTKIRAFVLNRTIPYLNDKITYYLQAFGLSTGLRFNNLLKVEMDQWIYEMHSGGERKRMDVVIMFAIHDLHDMMFGRQCNLLGLDEIDGSLDADGVDKFTEVLYSNYVERQDPETILIISHKDTLRDAFPTKINVKKSENFSYIEGSNGPYQGSNQANTPKRALEA